MSSIPAFHDCLIEERTGDDINGQAILGTAVTEKCAVVRNRLDSAHTTVRADASASRAYADEFIVSNRILLLPATSAAIGDKLTVHGVEIRINSLQPRYTVWAKLDHYEVSGEIWG